MSDIETEERANKEVPIVDSTTNTKYDKMVVVSLIVSIWLLSCILLHSYWIKNNAKVDYNKTMTRINTKRLEDYMRKYTNSLGVYKGELQSDSVSTETKRTLYVNMVKLMEAYDRCNYIRLNAQGSPFPFTEVVISMCLLLIVCCIILIMNLTNNPIAKQFQMSDLQKQIRELGHTTEDDLKNKEMREEYIKVLEKKIKQAKKDKNKELVNDLEAQLLNVKFMKGGNKKEALKLARIRANYNKISTKINFLKSDATFNQVSLSFAILLFSMYMSFKMFMSSYDYEENLYSGRLFTKSKCYQ